MSEGNGKLEVADLIDGYPQLCGLCGHAASAHTPDRCKICGNAEGKLHTYVRADVLACTLLNTITHQLDFLCKATKKEIEILERVSPDTKRPHILLPT